MTKYYQLNVPTSRLTITGSYAWQCYCFHCEVCGEYYGYGKALPFPAPESAKSLLTRKIEHLPLQEMKPVLASLCELLSTELGEKVELQPGQPFSPYVVSKLNVSDYNMDFHQTTDCKWFTGERFKQLIESLNITGVQFIEVTYSVSFLKKRKKPEIQLPKLYELFVLNRVASDAVTSVVCDHCGIREGGRSRKATEHPTFEFFNLGGSARFYVSERLKKLMEEQNFSNLEFGERLTYAIP